MKTASGGVWSGGAGLFSPGHTTLDAIYTPTASEIAAGSVTLALTTTGNGDCTAASDDVVLLFAGSLACATALPFGDLHCDAEVHVTGVQWSIIMALSMPVSDLLDTDRNGSPDACE